MLPVSTCTSSPCLKLHPLDYPTSESVFPFQLITPCPVCLTCHMGVTSDEGTLMHVESVSSCNTPRLVTSHLHGYAL